MAENTATSSLEIGQGQGVGDCLENYRSRDLNFLGKLPNRGF